MAGRHRQARQSRLDVLRERGFRLFFLGYLTSLLGTAIYPVAITFAVLDEGGTASDLGLVLSAQTVPLVVLVLAGGVLGDRLPRKPLMVGADLLRCGSQATLAFLLITGRPTIATMMALVAMLGVGQALFLPSMNGLIPEVTSAGRLQEANALRGVADSIGRTVGPAVGGAVVAVVNPGWAIALDAATYGASALFLAMLPLARGARVHARPMLAELRHGWHEFWSRTWLWVIVVQFAFWHMLVLAPFMVLGAVVADSSLGGSTAWGTILAAYGVGSICGGLVMVSARPSRPLLVATVGTFGLAAPLSLLALGAPAPAVAATCLLAGMGSGVFNALWNTTLQSSVPADARARVSSYDLFGSVVFLPLGYAAAGPLAAYFGTTTMLWTSAGWLVCSSALVLCVPGVNQLRARTPATPAAQTILA